MSFNSPPRGFSGSATRISSTLFPSPALPCNFSSKMVRKEVTAIKVLSALRRAARRGSIPLTSTKLSRRKRSYGADMHCTHMHKELPTRTRKNERHTKRPAHFQTPTHIETQPQEYGYIVFSLSMINHVCRGCTREKDISKGKREVWLGMQRALKSGSARKMHTSWKRDTQEEQKSTANETGKNLLFVRQWNLTTLFTLKEIDYFFQSDICAVHIMVTLPMSPFQLCDHSVCAISDPIPIATRTTTTTT